MFILPKFIFYFNHLIEKLLYSYIYTAGNREACSLMIYIIYKRKLLQLNSYDFSGFLSYRLVFLIIFLRNNSNYISEGTTSQILGFTDWAKLHTFKGKLL